MKNGQAEVMERFSLFLAGVSVGVVIGAIAILFSHWILLTALAIALGCSWYLGHRAYSD